ncbi:N-formylglutamate amidohydrolase [Mesorhizobium shangrilense]|uniref:N-formylglutamate amidohydrolase n=1 Tax=Mesorhizobium shangrilense TaxID=460060 RepID=A0ABV2DS56_9HYPH
MLSCKDDTPFAVFNAHGEGDVLLVCEHAAATIPSVFGDLGLQQDAPLSHIAWDPGALVLSMRLARMFDATLCYQRYSRLLYDCNRPPESPAAIRDKSETYNIPGNGNLSEQERSQRVKTFYRPFQKGLSGLLDARKRSGRQTVLATVHSFTPVYFGKPRDVEVGILHDVDTRFADAMLAQTEGLNCSYVTRRNEPYGPEDGVTHTLIEHGVQNGLLNVMIEVRNDLLRTQEEIDVMAAYLGGLISNALSPDSEWPEKTIQTGGRS